MVHSSKNLLWGLVVVGLATGCFSGEPLSDHRDGADDSVEPIEERYGAVSAGVSAQSAGEVDIQAQFLDARGVAVESALEALEVWAPRRGVEPGDCRVNDDIDRDSTSAKPVSLHLLDVGELEVETPEEQLSIPPRQLPDLLSSFYGVVYGSEWSDSDADATVGYHPEEVYRFTAGGSAEVDGFGVAVEAPAPMVLAAANGKEIRSRDSVTVDRSQELELVWETREVERGEVYIDLMAGPTPDAVRVQCRSGDDGAFSIPADKLQRFAETADLEIRRVHRTNVGVDGFDEVDVYFAAADQIELKFE